MIIYLILIYLDIYKYIFYRKQYWLLVYQFYKDVIGKYFFINNYNFHTITIIYNYNFHTHFIIKYYNEDTDMLKEKWKTVCN